jgi:hypothetical protein
MSECKACLGSGECPYCNGSGAEVENTICPGCGGKGSCPVCSGTITRSSTGEIKIDVHGQNPGHVKDVMSALLEQASSKHGFDEWGSAHPNVRLLLRRMDLAIEVEDYPSALHASASIFETLAKDIISGPDIENRTLASFFDKYRKESQLPGEVLDYILSIYKSRNTMPLAGHGSTEQPSVSKESAIILAEMTKAFLRIEYRNRKTNVVN